MFQIYAYRATESRSKAESIYDPLNDGYVLFSPKLHLEFGKAGYLQFTIPPTHFYYNSIKPMMTLVYVEDDDGYELFRGRVLKITRSFDNLKEIYCEGDLAYLVDSVQMSFAYYGTTHDLFSKIIQGHNLLVEEYKQFIPGNITIWNTPIKLVGSDTNPNTSDVDYRQIANNSLVDEWNNTYDIIQNALIDYCGGYLQTRRVGDNVYLDLWQKHTNERDAIIKFGENLIDLEEEVNLEDDDFFTVLIPLGDDNKTVGEVNHGSPGLPVDSLIKKYGLITRTHVFSNVSETSTLMENALRYIALKTSEEPTVTITVKAIDLHLIDDMETPIRIGDYVKIHSKPHDISRRLTCTTIDYDFVNPENSSYTLGNPKQTLTARYKEDDDDDDEDTSTSSSTAAASTASAVEEAIDKKIQKVKNDMYDEWVNWDPDNPDGKVSIGALYKKLDNTITTLRKAGIDIDATEGLVNLYSLQQKVDAQGNIIEEKSAGLETRVNDLEQSVQMYVNKVVGEDEIQGWIKLYVDQETDDIVAQINADKTEIMSAITTIQGEAETEIDNLKAVLKNNVGINVDAPAGKIDIYNIAQLTSENGEWISSTKATITSLSNGQTAQQSINASFRSDIDNAYAAVITTANSLGSRIDLKADKTVISGDLEVLGNRITATEAEIKNLKAKKITAQEINAAIANIDVLSVNGLHVTGGNIVCDSGIVYLGSASSGHRATTWDDVGSRLNNITSSTAPGNHHYHTLTVDNDGTVHLGYATSQPQSFNVKATRAYREGVAAAAAAANVSQIKKKHYAVWDAEEHFNTGADNYGSVTICVEALGENGNSLKTGFIVTSSYAYSQGLIEGVRQASGEGGAGWQAGWESVKIRSVTGDTSHVTKPEQQPQTHRYITIPLTAIAENGETGTGTVTYDAYPEYSEGLQTGREAGRQSVSVYPPTKSYKYNSQTHKYEITMQAQADNNNYSPEVKFETSTTAYDEGVSSVKFDPNFGPYQNGLQLSGAVKVDEKLVEVTAIAKLTTGTTNKMVTSFDVTNVYNSVTVGNPYRSVSDSYDTTNHKYTLKVRAKAANGEISPEAIFRTNTDAYDQGKTDGIAEGKASGIAEGKASIKFNTATAQKDTDAGLFSTITLLPANTSYSNTANRWTQGCVKVTLKNSSETALIRVMTDSTAAYSAGQTQGRKDVTFNSASAQKDTTKGLFAIVAIEEDNTTCNTTNANRWTNACLKVSLNNSSKTALIRVRMNSVKAYAAGKEAGKTEGYNSGYSAGYRAGKRDATSDLDYVSLIYVTMIGSDKVGIRAYHSNSNYEFKYLTAGESWNGFD